MRTSYIASSTPRASPHRYYTRNNQNPISPTASDNQQPLREGTPPTFLDQKRNIFNYRSGDSESSEDELDVQTGQGPKLQPTSRLQSAANLLRNIFMWIGLSFLTLNVYILSQLKKLWPMWKDPFLDTNLNKGVPDSPDRSYRAHNLSRAPMSSRLGSYDTISSPVKSSAPPASRFSEVGWWFLSALIFPAVLILLLGILLVPHPLVLDGKAGAETQTISLHLFSFLEEQKTVSAKVSKLEAGLLSLDLRTVKSTTELKSAIKDLEKEKERLESELVAIATLDRQQSSQLAQLHSQHSTHGTTIEGLSSSLNDVKLNYDNLSSQITLLRASITTLTTLQTTLSATQATESGRLSELGSSHQSLVERSGGLEKRVEELGAGQGEIRGLLEPLTSKQDKLSAQYKELTATQTTSAGRESADIAKLRAELLPLITDVKVDDATQAKIEEQGVAMQEYQEKLVNLETKISSIPTQQQQQQTIPPDLVSRLDTLTTELEAVRSTSPSTQQYTVLETRLDNIRGELERYVSSSGVRIQEVWSALEETRHKATEDRKVSQLKLQSIESKLAVLTALQDRLEKLEVNQVSGVAEDKRLQIEIAKLVADLRDMDVKYSEKVRALNLSLDALKSDKNSEASRTSEYIRLNTEELKTMKNQIASDVTSLQQKLADLESSADNKIRHVVLEVLSTVTHNSPDTRFFGDWLKANFLTREQFDREVRNERVVLPSQDQLIQIVISELHSKHSIDLHPASGITAADIQIIVKEALQTFDEDKTGRADFALEALGGNVISIGCTETYYEDAPYASFMSIPLYRQPNPPNVALQPDITPGKCWAFKGSKGYMMIKLAHAVIIDGFSMEHLSKKLSLSNDISSAPNKFSMRGFSHPEDSSSHFYGEYKFSDTGPSLQRFTVTHPSKVAYEIVELDIESNHGNLEYTCLYRIRVHGKVPKLS
ncbi:klaroid protein-like isoform X2 [Bolinopsis microptera]|uniref:klaroid protein-like isoform X2 n=1 Tax=Bolinopsis microptera TaxID=2820187 RepID=UPI00307B0549